MRDTILDYLIHGLDPDPQLQADFDLMRDPYYHSSEWKSGNALFGPTAWKFAGTESATTGRPANASHPLYLAGVGGISSKGAEWAMQTAQEQYPNKHCLEKAQRVSTIWADVFDTHRTTCEAWLCSWDELLVELDDVASIDYHNLSQYGGELPPKLSRYLSAHSKRFFAWTYMREYWAPGQRKKVQDLKDRVSAAQDAFTRLPECL